MPAFLTETFTVTSDTALSSRTSDSGHTWTLHPNTSSGSILVDASTDTARATTTAASIYYSSATPTNADYDTQADLVVKTVAGITGVCARLSTSATTYYTLLYYQTNGRWEIYKAVSGTSTLLGFSSQTLTDGASYTFRLECIGTAIKAYVGGTQVISVTDSSVTAAGRPGVVTQLVSATDTTGMHLDNLSATDVGGGGTTYTSTLTGAVTLAGTAVKRTGRLLTGAPTLAGTVSRQTARALAGTLTLAGTLAKQTARVLSGALTPSGTLSTALVKLLDLAGTVTSGGTMTRQISRVLAGVVSITGGIARLTTRALSGSVTSGGAAVGEEIGDLPAFDYPLSLDLNGPRRVSLSQGRKVELG
jgi:hypothetical protein